MANSMSLATSQGMFLFPSIGCSGSHAGSVIMKLHCLLVL